MSERPDPFQALYEIREYVQKNQTDNYRYRSEEERSSELEHQVVLRKLKLSDEKLKVKLVEAVTQVVDRNISIYEKKTDELLDIIDKFKEEAIAQEQAFQQASADLQKIKQGSTKALAKLNTKLAKNTAALREKEQELSTATEALATKSSEFEDISRALLDIQKDHSSCASTINSLEIELRDAKAINNASRTSIHAEADRIQKGIAKATVELEARLKESEYRNQGLERKCRMLEERYSEQVIASAKKEEQIIRSVVEERRSHDRVLELQRDLGKEETRYFELELSFQDLCHKFGDDKE
ncbi:hypothetical protein BPOR_0598g00020 [Botrytis porri]|uniref:Uncharacterized protein n=1 Tax=Botrytis porri TaxID=87229 RepID=A0A4Z1KJK9_9HELO|nr:hypothetical protein BPOR_0598g00020 [Botrytis porri]